MKAKSDTSPLHSLQGVKRQHILDGLSKAIVASDFSFTEISRLVVKWGGTHIGDGCILSMVSADNKWLLPLASYHRSKRTLAVIREILTSNKVKIGEGLAGTVAKTGKPGLIKHINQELYKKVLKPKFHKYLETVGIHSLLIVPVVAGGQLVGTLGLTRDKPGKPYTSKDRDLLQKIASQSAIALQNSWLTLLIQEKENRYWDITRNIPGAVFQYILYFNGKQEITMMTSGAEDIFERPVENIKAPEMIFSDMHPDDLPGFLSGIHESAKSMKRFIMDARLVMPDKRIKWLRVSSNPRPLDDRGILWNGVILDVTREKEAETTIVNKNRELEELISEKDKLLSVIAHDLRSPVSSLAGLTGYLTDETRKPDPQKTRSILLTIRKTALSTFDLLENLLDWARLRRNLLLPEFSSLAPRAIIDEILYPYMHGEDKKRLKIVNEVAEDIEVNTDRRMFSSIIRNLVSNAVKFTRVEGTITISVEVASDNLLKFIVTDTGIGMSDLQKNSLFLQKIPGSQPGLEGEQGAGLGLLLSKEFTELCGGSFGVESQQGKGSTFWFTVPVASKTSRQ